ncbi:protein kinase domain-containing protein [Haliangium ochraceum]|uniref:Serine/threonine protein kinase n=1 Tax=Haliangium ochraceum (strain DSM 14365 / JCM 11303 / SMP-2) TaxID=502025 RepID=D0LL48_HALO1|nr:protein kinase [Haliangium ochraceum]ACY18544.1 serine/threonine protein kinase [Haliangium ochraceum DSM 14365]
MAERQFGPYRLVQQVAVGGMAEIYLAKARGIAGFEKFVALKMIHPNFSLDENFIEMLVDEAKISVQLQHVNIAQTFDLGRVDDTYYITMEFVDGADLYKILVRAAERSITMPVDVAAFIAKEMANGLDAAHRQRDMSGEPLNIVHRDVSPQNVLVSYAGEVKLVDFGIAKATMKVRQTAVGVIKGKYYYMSPEQAWGEAVDHRTDIFSTGVVLYEALTGRMLYQEDDIHRLLQQVRNANIEPPTRRRRDIPPQLERIVMRALAKDREERYQSAGDMATDLERFLHVYSPVFTGSKLAAFYRQVLEEDEAPNSERFAEAKPAAKKPSLDIPMHTMRLEPAQILNESDDFIDENSIIFDTNERGGSLHDASGPGGKFSTSAHTFSGVESDFPGDIDDLDNIEEQTLVSGIPGFGMGNSNMPSAGGDDFEATLVGDMGGGGFDEGVTLNTGGMDPASDEGTLLQGSGRAIQEQLRRANNLPPLGAPAQQSKAPQAKAPPPRPPRPPTRPGRTGAKAQPPAKPAARPTRQSKPGARGRGAANPVQAANVPKPSISFTGGPRRSRKTPADGTPGPSLLSALVPNDSAAPVRRDAPAPADSGPSPAAAGPGPSAPGQPGPQTAGHPASGPQTAEQPAAGAPGQQLAGQPAPGQPGNGYAPGGFGQAPGATGQGPTVGAPYHFTALPQGVQPNTFTGQLRALELTEAPERFKVGRKAPAWLLGALLVAACVAAGVGLGIFLLSDKAEDASLQIESMPSGAKVTINGMLQDEPTPLRFPAKLGTRYAIDFEKGGFQTKHHEVLVPNEARVYRVSVTLQRIRGSAEILSEPPNAEIWLNNALQGRAPRTLKGLDPDSEYSLELRHKGYKPHTQSLVWPEGQTELRLEIKLQK